jgi:lipopolysaccharide/colanic/teichoic acid biosynthesis glycosyltransferase
MSRTLQRTIKWIADRLLAALAIIVLSPVFLVLTAWVLLDAGRPVLFVQRRTGKLGREFPMLKYRSMVNDAVRVGQELGVTDDPHGVVKDDPRITRSGRFLRRSSLDELPQLFNVLRGEMSLVGPRPPLQSEVEQYGYDMRRRFLVKPGLTGLWQVSGRSDLSWDDSVRIDVRYVENWSLVFDLMILWKTVGAVLRGSGAY